MGLRCPELTDAEAVWLAVSKTARYMAATQNLCSLCLPFQLPSNAATGLQQSASAEYGELDCSNNSLLLQGR
jgi:hypothetical protein